MLMEKPVSDDVATGWELVAATEQAGVPMLVGHHRRHSPLIRQAKEMLASGAVGRVTTVNGLCWFLKPKPYFDVAWRREPGAGVVLINLIHVIDDLRNLCGDIESVQALASNAVRGFAVEDTAAMLLRFRSGALGTISISDTVAAPWSWELTSGEDKAFPHTDEACYLVGGTEGAISVPRLEHWRHTGEQGWRSPIEAKHRVVPEQDPLVLQLRQFCRVVRREEAPLLDGREAMKTLEATLAVKESAATGRRSASLEHGGVMYHHLLLPTDGSEPSVRAFTAGIALAKTLGARVTGLSVVAQPQVASGLGDVMVGRDDAVQAATSTSPPL